MVVSDIVTTQITNNYLARPRIGDAKHVMTYTIGAGTSFNMVLSHPDSTDPSKWDSKMALQDMKTKFEDWDPG
jgi:salicylate hydroxylase